VGWCDQDEDRWINLMTPDCVYPVRLLPGVPNQNLPSSAIRTKRNATRKDGDQDNFFKTLRAKAGSRLDFILTCL